MFSLVRLRLRVIIGEDGESFLVYWLASSLSLIPSTCSAAFGILNSILAVVCLHTNVMEGFALTTSDEDELYCWDTKFLDQMLGCFVSKH